MNIHSIRRGFKKDPNEFKNLDSDHEYANVIKKLSKWLPQKNARPVPGSTNRILIHKKGVIVWDEVVILETKPIPEF